jgi:hypothetical protein
VSWTARREACHDGLSKYVGAIPWIRVNPKNAAPLVRCLDGGWHYPTDISGHVNRELPEKRGISASLGDAFAHLVAVLLRRSPARIPGNSGERPRVRPTVVNAYASVKSRTGV